MLNGDIDTVELEGQIVSTVSLEGDLLPIGPKGDKGDDGFSPVVTTSKSGKTTTIKFETATGNVYAYVQDGEDGQGSGDMLTDVYDQNKNGIVDNAEACNGHTLAKDVPADAVFTDTTYESKEAASGGSDVSLCTTGEKYTWNNKSDFSGSYNDLTNKPTIPTKTSDLTNDSGFINNTVNNLTNYTPTSSLSTVALTGSYSDLSNKPSIPSKTSDLTNDSGFIDKTVNDLTNYYKKSDTYTKTEANTLLGAKANSSDLATVATSGSYNDLSNKPTIPDELADLSDDSTHRLVSDTEKETWNNKVDSTGDATTTGENTSFSLANVLEAPLLIDLKGNTSQNTLSGKNLCGFADGEQTINNVKATYTNGVINLKGTANATGFITINLLKTIPGGTYCLSANNTQTVGDSTNLTALRVNNEGGFQCALYNQNTYNSQVYNTNITYITIRIANGTVYNDFKITPQIEAGLNMTSYEPYCGCIPSPNPSYPQPVNVVSGDNDINVYGVNLYHNTTMETEFHANFTDFSYNVIDDNSLSITASSTSTSQKSCAVVMAIDTTKLKPNTQYTLTCNNSVSGTTFTNAGALRAKVGDTYGTTSTNNSVSFTTPATITTIGIAFYLAYNTQMTGTSTITFSNIMLNEGATTLPYIPYTGTTYNIDLPVENLYEKGTIQWFRNNTSTFNDTNNTNTSRIRSMPIQIKGGNTYTLSGIPSELTLNAAGPRCYDINKTYLGDSYVQYSGNTLTLPSNVAYISIMCNGTNLDNTTNTLMNNADIQIEQGSKANSYTPYGTTPIELCKIGTYQDYFYKEDDKWYLHKEVGKVVLDGSENWLDRSASGRQYFTIAGSTHKREGLCFANYYGFINSINTSIDYGIRLGGAEFTQIVNVDITSVADFKTWLGTHNTIVNYVLATPTNTEITYQPLLNQLNALEDAESYEETTNVNQVNNDLPFIIGLTAFNNNYNGRYRSLKYMYDKISSGGNN